MQRKVKLSREGIAKYLPDQFEQSRIQVFEEIDSTNTEAKRQARNGAPDGTVLVANSQRNGRGRLGRNFYSPQDGGVYFSILLRPTLPAEDTVLITVAASVQVAEAIQSVCGVYPDIKWVNDLYYEGKKVCGILAELVSDSETGNAVVLGVGINCYTEFPDELQDIAGNVPCVEDIKNRLAAELSVRLSELESVITEGEFLTSYREHSMVIGKWVTIPQEAGSLYYVCGIGERGGLILKDREENSRILTTGEISIRLTTPH